MEPWTILIVYAVGGLILVAFAIWGLLGEKRELERRRSLKDGAAR